MEADPFAWIVDLCRPTASPANLPMARMLEFSDSDSDPSPAEQMSVFAYSDSDPSPDPTQTEATEIYMVSLSESSDSVHQRPEEDEAAFHTPPENPPSHLSSSEDQNVDEGAVVGPYKRQGDRDCGGGLPEGKKQKSVDLEIEDTVPVDDTEVIVDDDDNNNNNDDDNEIVVDLDVEESVKATEVVNLVEEGCVRGNGVVDLVEERVEVVGRRKLPESLKGKDMEKKCGLLEVLDILKVVFKKPDEGSEGGKDEDFFAMIQRKGFTVPTPRWRRDGLSE